MEQPKVVEEATSIFNWLLEKVKSEDESLKKSNKITEEEHEIIKPSSVSKRSRKNTSNLRQKLAKGISNPGSAKAKSFATLAVNLEPVQLETIFKEMLSPQSYVDAVSSPNLDQLDVASEQWNDCVGKKCEIRKKIDRELTKQAKLTGKITKQRKQISSLKTKLKKVKESLRMWKARDANLNQTKNLLFPPCES